MDRLLTIEELLIELDSYDHKALHVHHTWKPNHSNFTGSNYQSIQNGMRDYHMNVKNWSDIAQHVTLYPDGKFLTGRDFGRNPASISNYNTGAFCMEMLGDFDKGNDVFEGPQKDSALQLAKYFDDKSKAVIFHNEKSTKTCPGTSIAKIYFMDEVRNYAKISEENQPSAWAKEPWQFGIDNGIISGNGPRKPITKEEVMTMIFRNNNR